MSYVKDDGWKADEGFVPTSHTDLIPDITLFYLSDRIFPKGHAKTHKEKTKYAPPSKILSQNPNIDIESCLEWVDLAEGAPANYFGQILSKLENVPKKNKEAFQAGKIVEIIHPKTRKSVEMALIVNSDDDNFFLAKLLGSTEDIYVVRHCLSSDILPYGWSNTIASNIKPLRTLDTKDEKITEDLFHNHVINDTSKFECGKKMEVRSPNGEFHSGTIVEVKDHIIVIELDNDDRDAKDLYITPFNSMDIFPIGWSQTNDLPIMLPTSFLNYMNDPTQETSSLSKEIKTTILSNNQSTNDVETSSWCPKIYFNYKCYSASFLSKARLASLPRSVGPGTVRLVMREVISLLVGSSYKSGSILNRLECNYEVPRKDFVIEEIKGKSRVLNLKANIEIPTRAYQVEKMCKEVCQKVGACPHLVSMQRYLSDEGCPADCQNRPKSNFINNDETANGNSQTSYQKSFLSGLSSTSGIGIKRRRDKRRKKRTNPDRLLIAEHIQLKRQKSRDQMGSEVNSSCEVSSGGSDCDDDDTVPTSLASTAASTRSNSPNGQMYTNDREDRSDRRNKKGRGRKEWERYWE